MPQPNQILTLLPVGQFLFPSESGAVWLKFLVLQIFSSESESTKRKKLQLQ